MFFDIRQTGLSSTRKLSMSVVPVAQLIPYPANVGLEVAIKSCKKNAPGNAEQGQAPVLQWTDPYWHYATNGLITMRQLMSKVRVFSKSGGNMPTPAALTVLFAAVNQHFKGRNTTVADWRCISSRSVDIESFQQSTPRLHDPDFLGMLHAYGDDYVAVIRELPGSLVAEDKGTQTLHFLFDGGQGFVRKSQLWGRP